MVFGTPHVYEHFFTICSLCSILEPFSTLETPVKGETHDFDCWIQQNRAKLTEKNEINWMNECCQKIFLYTPCGIQICNALRSNSHVIIRSHVIIYYLGSNIKVNNMPSCIVNEDVICCWLHFS